MATKSKSTKKDNPSDGVVCRNRRARHDYDILDELECGMVLTGSEIKSIRNGKISINEAFARVEDGEVWLHNADIATYPQATVMNHDPRRSRKLLMKRREVKKFAESAAQQGLTLIPLDVHFNRGLAKLTLAIAKGRKLHDKREKLRKEDDKRAMRAAMRRRT